MIKRFSSYRKVIRIVAYILRAIRSFRFKKKFDTSILTVNEIDTSFLKVIEIIQSVKYKREIDLIRLSKPLAANIQKWNSFLQEHEEEGIKLTLLRVGGRLLNAPLDYNAKFPLPLSKDSHFVQIYLRYLHADNCHAGSKLLLSLLRQKIWIVNGREAVRKIVRNCIPCFKFKPKLLTQIMGNLPPDRFTGWRPFTAAGVDFVVQYTQL